MIDRPARDRLASNLRRLASGRITNDEFEASHSDSSPDRAVEQIGAWAQWHYDDSRVYRLIGKDRLPLKTRRTAARAVLFLRTDREYEWPEWPAMFSFRNLAVAAVGVVLLAMAGGMLYFRIPGGEKLWALGLIVVTLSAGLLVWGPWSLRGQWRHWRQRGDAPAWPFLRSAELEAARRGGRFPRG